MTSWPASSSALTVAEPTFPRDPVTRILMPRMMTSAPGVSCTGTLLRPDGTIDISADEREITERELYDATLGLSR